MQTLTLKWKHILVENRELKAPLAGEIVTLQVFASDGAGHAVIPIPNPDDAERIGVKLIESANKSARSSASADQCERKRLMPKDKKNAYYCDACKEYTVTIDVDEGTTPFYLGCRATMNCHGLARSMFYPAPESWPAFIRNREPKWEWYKPANLCGLSEGERDHVKSGGLLIRRRGGIGPDRKVTIDTASIERKSDWYRKRVAGER